MSQVFFIQLIANAVGKLTDLHETTILQILNELYATGQKINNTSTKAFSTEHSQTYKPGYCIFIITRPSHLPLKLALSYRQPQQYVHGTLVYKYTTVQVVSKQTGLASLGLDNLPHLICCLKSEGNQEKKRDIRRLSQSTCIAWYSSPANRITGVKYAFAKRGLFLFGFM